VLKKFVEVFQRCVCSARHGTTAVVFDFCHAARILAGSQPVLRKFKVVVFNPATF
jgi:hypothetical protein